MNLKNSSDGLSEKELIGLYLDLATCFGGVIAASKVHIPDRLVWEIVGALGRVFDTQWRRVAAASVVARQPRPAISSLIKMLRSLEAQLIEDINDY